MTLQDEARRLRIREGALVDDAARLLPDQVGGSPCLAVRTATQGAYPTAARRYFACHPLTILGAEFEGASGIVTTDSTTLFALNLGAAIPPPGMDVLATFVDNRWVFRYD